MIDSGRLQDILREEEVILQKMLELEEQTRQVLIERDVAGLEKLNAQKEQLAANMLELEQQRAVTVPENITLKEYLHRENPPGAAKLEHLRRSILDLHDSLRSRQKITRRLLLFNQQLVEQALRLLVPHAGENLYSASGAKNQKKTLRTGILDSNA